MDAKSKLIKLIFLDKSVLTKITEQYNLADKLFFENKYFINNLINDDSLNDNFVKSVTNLMIKFSSLFHYFKRIISINKNMGQGIYLICSFNNEILHLNNFYSTQITPINWIKFPQIFRYKNFKYAKTINFIDEYSFKFTDCIDEINETISIKFEKENFIYSLSNNNYYMLLYYDTEFKTPYVFKFTATILNNIYETEKDKFLEATKSEKLMRKFTMDKLKTIESIDLISVGYILPQAPFMHHK